MDEEQKVNDKYTLNEFIVAVKGSRGIKETIRQRLGCNRKTVDSYLNRYATAREAYDGEIEIIGDVAESVIINDIVANRSVETAKWYAVKKLAPRGYKDKSEMQVSGELTVVQKGYGTAATPDDWDETAAES